MASTKPKLYAWARPVRWSQKLGDHTYVTDYDEPFDGDPPSRSWYCAGEVESSGSSDVRCLVAAEADIAFAEFICTPDDPRRFVPPRCESTAGIIYGVTGVCHQVANRILFAVSGDAPCLVDNAKGYLFGYGDYGLDETKWRDRLARYGEA